MVREARIRILSGIYEHLYSTLNACVCVCVVHIYTDIYIYTYTHAYIHIYAHAYSLYIYLKRGRARNVIYIIYKVVQESNRIIYAFLAVSHFVSTHAPETL